MYIIEIAALVTFNGMTYLIVVGVLEIVFRGGIHRPGTGTPSIVSIGKTQELIISTIGTYSLYILYSVALIK